MRIKNKGIRLFFLLFILLALAVASVSPFITIDPISRGLSSSLGHSTYSSGTMVFQQVMMTYLIAAFSLSCCRDLLKFLLFRMPINRFDCTVPKRMRKVLLYPIKFTSHFVAF